MSTNNTGMSQNDLDAQHAEQFQTWAESDTLGGTDDVVQFPLSSDQMAAIGSTGFNEGWRLTEVEGGTFSGLYVLECEDEKNVFENDSAAEEFVRKQAGQGSEVHQWALAGHMKPVEEVGGKVVNVQLVLNVGYRLNGVSIEELMAQLESNMNHMIGNGGLTGPTEAETETYSFDVTLKG